MSSPHFQFSFTSTLAVQDVFSHLLDVKAWWTGLFGEEIKGHSENVGDEFAFTAGDGIHSSTQRLVELIPNQKISWLVTESNLSFLTHTNEWTDTQFGFDLEVKNGVVYIAFTHQGLIPGIECYAQCSSAWTQYLHKLANHLK